MVLIRVPNNSNMLTVVITLGLLLNTFLAVNGGEESLAARSPERRGLLTDLKDSEAEEDSSFKYKEVFGGKRSRRNVVYEDLIAQEDDSTKFKSVKETEKSPRAKRNPQSWRTPRNYQFITRTTRHDRDPSGRSGRLIESGGRFYDDRTKYPEYNSRNNVQDYNRRPANFQNRRIIYYATLPEPTRRPEYERYLRDYERDYRDREYERQYYDKNYDRYYSNPTYNTDYDRFNEYNNNNRYDQNYNRQYEANYNRPSYPGYPPVRDNEITRVTSSIIDVSSSTKDEKTERIRDDPGLSKYVIIDREPPYLRDVYNFLSSYHPNDEKYSELLSKYAKEEVTERNTKKPPRKQTSVPVPPVELTVFKGGKQLDIRPLDITIETSSNTSNKDRPTSTHKPTTLNPIQEFERSYKY